MFKRLRQKKIIFRLPLLNQYIDYYNNYKLITSGFLVTIRSIDDRQCYFSNKTTTVNT